MFDEDLVAIFREAITAAFRAHAGVLRSVVVNFDYYGTLNDTPGLQKGMFMGPHGGVRTPDAILGSAKNVIESLHAILERGQQMALGLEGHLTKLQQSIVNAQKEIDGKASTEKGPVSA